MEHFAYSFDLVLCQLGKARQGQNVLDSVLCDGQSNITVLPAPGRLAMIGSRVVHVRADSCLLERRSQALAILRHDDGQVRNVILSAVRHKAADLGRQHAGVAPDDLSSAPIPLVETTEAKSEHGRLKLVEPRVSAAEERHLV